MTPPGINLKWQTPIRRGNRSSIHTKIGNPPTQKPFIFGRPTVCVICYIYYTFYIFFFFFVVLCCCCFGTQCFRSKRIWLPGTHTLPIASEKIKLFASLLFGAQKHFMHLWHRTIQQSNHPLKTSQTSPFSGTDFFGLGPSPVFIAALLYIGFIFSYSAVSVFFFSFNIISVEGVWKSCSNCCKGVNVAIGFAWLLLLSRFSHIS